MADDIVLVQCRRGHKGLTICPSCKGTGLVEAGTKGSHLYVHEDGSAPTLPSGDPVCPSCFGSGLLQPHGGMGSCFSSSP